MQGLSLCVLVTNSLVPLSDLASPSATIRNDKSNGAASDQKILLMDRIGKDGDEHTNGRDEFVVLLAR